MTTVNAPRSLWGSVLPSTLRLTRGIRLVTRLPCQFHADHPAILLGGHERRWLAPMDLLPNVHCIAGVFLFIDAASELFSATNAAHAWAESGTPVIVAMRDLGSQGEVDDLRERFRAQFDLHQEDEQFANLSRFVNLMPAPFQDLQEAMENPLVRRKFDACLCLHQGSAATTCF